MTGAIFGGGAKANSTDGILMPLSITPRFKPGGTRGDTKLSELWMNNKEATEEATTPGGSMTPPGGTGGMTGGAAVIFAVVC